MHAIFSNFSNFRIQFFILLSCLRTFRAMAASFSWMRGFMSGVSVSAVSCASIYRYTADTPVNHCLYSWNEAKQDYELNKVQHVDSKLPKIYLAWQPSNRFLNKPCEVYYSDPTIDDEY